MAASNVPDEEVTTGEGDEAISEEVSSTESPMLASNVPVESEVVSQENVPEAQELATASDVPAEEESTSQNAMPTEVLMPASDVSAADVTVLPGNAVAQLESSSSKTSLGRLSSQVFQLRFDLKDPNAFTKLSLNFDPKGTGEVVDLSELSQLVFGLDSVQAKVAKIEIKDAKGKRATRYVRNVDVSRNYYKFLTAGLASEGVDVAQIVEINIGVDTSSVSVGNETGDLHVEIGGLS